jgi:hypothetical protein
MKKFKAVFAAATLLLSVSLFAQERVEPAPMSADVSEMCAKTKCQRDLRVTLKDKSGATFDRTFPTLPAAAQPFGVIVVAGQTVFVEADVVDGKLVNLVSVGKVSNPSKTITATFEQVDGKGMMLTVSNPFPDMLKFRMAIMPLDQQGLLKTSSCPVGARIRSVEMWPDPIFQVVLTGGHTLPKDTKVICEY